MPYPQATDPFRGAEPTYAYTGNFIPEVWSGKLVEKFYSATVLGAVANTDYEGEIKNFGDKVQIRSRPTITIEDYSANLDLTLTRPSGQKQTLNIDRGKYFNLGLDDVMEVQADIDMLSLWAEDASEQMKITIDGDVLNGPTRGDGTGIVNSTLVNAANRGLYAGAISGNQSSFGLRLGIESDPTHIAKDNVSAGSGADGSNEMGVLDYLVNCGTVLDEQNLPESGRFVVIPAWVAGLIKKSDLRDASISGDGTSILRNGRLGMIDRFTLYLSNVLQPTTSYTASYPVIFGTKAALTFASQYVNLETLRSERSFTNILRGLQVFGFRIVNGVALGYGFVENN